MTDSPIPSLSPANIAAHSGGLTTLGAFLIVLGVLAISIPNVATFAIETFIGCLIFFGGLAHLFHAFRPSRWKGFLLDIATGGVFVVTGVLLLLYPFQGEQTLTLILAAALIAEGIFKLIASVLLRGQPGLGWMVFSGLITLSLGIMIGGEWPSAARWVLGLFFGINLVFGGWTLMMLGIAVRRSLNADAT